MKRSTTCPALVVLTLSLGLVLAAGSAPAQTKLKMAQATLALSFAPVYIAHHLKYWAQEGLEVDLQLVSGVVGSQALTGGTVEFDADGTNNIVRLAGRGIDAVVVYGLVGPFSQNLVMANPTARAKGISPASPIATKLAALKGLTLGITTPGSLGDTFTRYLLKQANLDPGRDVQIVQVGSTDGLLAAIQTGQIQAFLMSPPAPETAEARGHGSVVLRAGLEIPVLRSFVQSSVGVMRPYMERNGDTIRRVNRALARATALLLDHPEEAKQVLQASYFQRIPPEILSKSVDGFRPAYLRDGRMTEEQWRNMLKVFQELGMVPRPLDSMEGKVWTNQFLP
ncbi:MAG: ABC transporter substrate-binding protein [Deltaproteobacteria bacterium]|nr:ABC transporter substrate-binding protein [Deltaproteobacteria bacterium]